MPFNYDDIMDIPYNPFISNPANRYTPKKVGYGANPVETYTIDSKGQISLYNFVMETLAQTVQAKDATTAETLTETTSLTPAKNQFSVCYDELGNGIVQFHSSRIGHSVQMKYYALGTRPQESTMKFSILGNGYTKIIASYNSSLDAKEIADEIISLSDDAGAKLNAIATELNTIGGGEIKVLEGSYYFDTKYTGKANVKLTGSGFNTKFIRRANIDYIIDNSYDGVILNYFSIDGNDSSYTGNGIKQTSYKSSLHYIWSHNNSLYGFGSCYNMNTCFSYENGTGYNSCEDISNCRADNNTGNGYTSCERLSNCYSKLNSGDGYNSCTTITTSYADDNTGNGYRSSIDLSSCQSINNGSNGYYECIEITTSRALSNGNDGFLSCDTITGCKAQENSNYGFNLSKVMGFNRAIVNTTGQYNGCTSDRAGLLSVADDENGGFNAAT